MLRARLHAAVGGLPPVLWTILAGMFVNRLGTFVGTFLALYLVRERGFPPDAAGRVVALFGAGVLVAGPLGGTLADAIGRRRTMLLSFLLGAAAVATIAFLRHPALLALFTFLSALTSELYRPAMAAAIADVVPPEDRARAWGLVYWVTNLGWTFGLAIGGALAVRSFTALFLVDAASTLAFAAVVARRVPETRPAGSRVHPPLEGLALVLADGPFVRFLLLNLAMLVVFVQFQLAAPLDMDAHGVGPGTFAALLSLDGLAVILLQPVLTPALARRDGGRLLALSALLVGCGFGVNALAGWLPPLPVYVVGVILWAVGEVIGFPVAAAIVADLAPPELRGRYQGAFSMSWGIAFTIAPLVGGELLTRFGGRTLWAACLAIGAVVAAGHLTAGPARRRRLAALRATDHSPAP
ncbi:MAG TPA: MFS transporter [Anaeromyxobacteraceae bacterium]|nr:MFS transporter [Anaeromyxobacteraceae bacterium]